MLCFALHIAQRMCSLLWPLTNLPTIYYDCQGRYKALQLFKDCLNLLADIYACCSDWHSRKYTGWIWEADLNTDQMSLIANSPSPVLLGLGEKLSGTHTHHWVVEIMCPSPELKELPNKLCKGLLVLPPKVWHCLVVVVTLPMTHCPVSRNAFWVTK